MNWTIAIPLKAAGARKTRLADMLDGATRERAVAAMLAHVTQDGMVDRGVTMMLVAPERPAGWNGAWYRDTGEGLNAALAAARGAGPFAVIHPDLPLLAPDDVRALLDAATLHGMALAPDRHGGGTNALAIADGRPVEFVFGPDSGARFAAQGPCAIVRRPGFALDIDTAADLRLAQAAGRLLDIHWQPHQS